MSGFDMNVSSDDLDYCLRQADLISHDFLLNCRDSSNPARDIGEVLRTFERALGAKVEVFEVPITVEHGWVMGMCLLSDDKKIEIGLARDLDEPLARYVLCKELFHQALDRPEYRNVSIAGHIEEYTLTFPDDESSPRKPVVAEFLAEVGAMEILFPFKQRVRIVDSKPDHDEVAKRFQLPKLYTQKYLSTSFMKNLERFSKV